MLPYTVSWKKICTLLWIIFTATIPNFRSKTRVLVCLQCDANEVRYNEGRHQFTSSEILLIQNLEVLDKAKLWLKFWATIKAISGHCITCTSIITCIFEIPYYTESFPKPDWEHNVSQTFESVLIISDHKIAQSFSVLSASIKMQLWVAVCATFSSKGIHSTQE